MLWRLASAWGDSPAKNSWTICRLNSIEYMRCLAMGFLLESPGQLADSQVPYLSTPRGALQMRGKGRGPTDRRAFSRSVKSLATFGFFRFAIARKNRYGSSGHKWRFATVRP